MARRRAVVEAVAPDFSEVVTIGTLQLHIKPQMSLRDMQALQRACHGYQLDESEVTAEQLEDYRAYVAYVTSDAMEPVDLPSHILHWHMNRVDEKAANYAYSQMPRD